MVGNIIIAVVSIIIVAGILVTSISYRREISHAYKRLAGIQIKTIEMEEPSLDYWIE